MAGREGAGRHVLLATGLICAGLVGSQGTGRAAESAPVVTSHTRASLVSSVDDLPGPLPAEGRRAGAGDKGDAGRHGADRPATETGFSLRVGLRLQLRPGWHTYWQNPGDAGEPAHVHVTVSGAYAGEAEQVDWPVPERVSEGGLMAYAYQGDVLLPLRVFLHDSFAAGREIRQGQQDDQDGRQAPGRGMVHVQARADWLVCADVCVPESGRFDLALPVQGETGPRAGQEAGSGQPVLSGSSGPVPAGDGDALSPARQAGAHGGGSAEAALFQRADADMPRPSPFAARVTPAGLLVLEGTGLSSEAVRQGWFLPQEGGVIAQDSPQPLTVRPGRMTLQLSPDPYAHPPFWQKPLVGLVVLMDAAGNRSALHVTALPGPGPEEPGPAGTGMRKDVVQSPAAGPMQPVAGQAGQPGPAGPETDHAAAGESRSIPGNMLSAFLGGVILNLMPCVFPVLVMKLLSFARMGGAGWRVRGRSALFYSLGVMGCFAGLGVVMMALRYGGAAVGWGFQFQSTGFVIGVGWLLFVLALNLLGVFQITGGRLAGRAGQVAGGHGPANDLLAGLLAVLVATPCTAPFMGVAIAAALAGPYWAGLIIFLSMGSGLAAPYVVLALMPGLARHLPRPGAWMERLRQVLAFPLLASCVWLLWVASLQRGGDAVLLMAGGAVLLGLGSWLHGLAQQRAMRGDAPVLVWSVRLLAALCLLGCLAGLGRMVMTGDEGPAMPSDTRAAGPALPAGGKTDRAAGTAAPLVEPFSQDRLDRLRVTGTPVLVDMTASWCVTCMVNERVALDVPSVRQAFHQHGVTILRGDWTRHDGRITAFLKAHGRDGVPFYLYYPPGGGERSLPQLLTPGIVLAALEENRSRR